jgi:LacI family transcriptional regulator
MKKPISTIRDVAAGAGVSTATVSKFVNGTQRFSPGVEEAIARVIAELGYRSNPLAQSMITGRTQSIGLSLLDVANPHFTSVVKGANRVAQAHGYNLLLVDTEENPHRERPLLEALSRRVDGLIVISRMNEAEMNWMLELGKPLVFFGRLLQHDIAWVAGDDQRGASMLVRHLITLGHRRLAYLGFSKSRRRHIRSAPRACRTDMRECQPGAPRRAIRSGRGAHEFFHYAGRAASGCTDLLQRSDGAWIYEGGADTGLPGTG